jgi:hypothetical protein
MTQKSQIFVWGNGCLSAARTMLTFEGDTKKHGEIYYQVTADIRRPKVESSHATAEGQFKQSFVQDFFERVLNALDGPQGYFSGETGVGNVSVSLYWRGELIEKKVSGEDAMLRATSVIFELLSVLKLVVDPSLFPCEPPSRPTFGEEDFEETRDLSKQIK